jgi:hypothetical protein
MSSNLKSAVIFGVGLAIGMAVGNSALAWTKRTLS